MPLLDDVLYAIHERSNRQGRFAIARRARTLVLTAGCFLGETHPAHDRSRRHAPSPTAEKPHGIDDAEQNRVLHLHPQHHPEIGRAHV